MKPKGFLSLSSIRKFFFSLIAVFVGILMVVMFTLPGEVAGNRNQVVGKLNGKPIDFSQGSTFANNVLQISNYYKQQGLGTAEGFHRYIQLQAFEQTITSELSMQASLDFGIYLEDAEVVATIQERYFTQDGQFDKNGYKSFQQHGKPQVKKNIEKTARHLLHRGYLDNTLFGFVPLSEPQRQKRLRDLSLERKVLLASIDADAEIRNNTTEEALQAFHEQNAETLYANKGFEAVRGEVSEDHFNRNRERLFIELQRSLAEKTASLREAKDEGNFRRQADALGFKIVDVEAFNVYAEQLYENEEMLSQFGEVEGLIGALFSTPIKSVSTLVRSGDFFLLGYVQSQSENERLRGSFRQKQTLIEYEDGKRQQLASSFQSSLREKATIVSYLGEETQQ